MAEIILNCANVALSTTLSELIVPVDALMFLERVPDCWLDRAEIADGIRMAAYDPATNWAQWERGRVFCQQWELRWEGQQAVYTGAQTALTNFANGPNLLHATRREISYYLWGKRDGQRFIELQVARVFNYPVIGGTRVKLRAAEWFDDAGNLLASRFLKLEVV